MTCHYPNPGSVPDWLKTYFNQPEVIFAVGNLWIILLLYLAQELLSGETALSSHTVHHAEMDVYEEGKHLIYIIRFNFFTSPSRRVSLIYPTDI